MREASEPTRIYWLMNGLSTVIASYGLLANSPAVVIGAMVVALLLNPLAGVALGLNESDRKLLGRAFLSLAGGIGWILAIAVVIGFIHHDIPLTPEIRARTNPNLFDLIIALAGGAAGAVAVLSPRVGTAIVGVAVATALVPPLAAAGILLARAEFDLAGGALLLVLTNIVAIQVAFSAVFWVGGYRWHRAVDEQGMLAFLRRNLVSIGLVCGLAVVLGFQMKRVIGDSLFLSAVRAVLHRHFDDDARFHLVDVRVSESTHVTTVRAVVRGAKPPSATEVAEVQGELPSPPDGSTIKLRVRFVDVVVVTAAGGAAAGQE
ncbi:MAG TPA: DUF389 domain-containing protein [Stellaceae bacterium]|nr:DUF389 domain-containing protein [Stellaceae bacterium]